MRYVAYIRTSTNEHPGAQAIDAQRRAIEAWVDAQAGQLVEVYVDESHAGHVIDRPALQRMLRDARLGRFDALVVHRLDRLARKRADLHVIQSTLDNHNIKLCAASVKEVYA